MAKVTLVNDAPRVRNVLGKFIPPGEHEIEIDDLKLLNASIKDMPGLRIKGKNEKADDSAAKKAEEEAEKKRLAEQAEADKAAADKAAEEEKQKQLQETQGKKTDGWKQ